MSVNPSRTLRLNIPQWQGSDHPDYLVGGRVLAALAPASSGPEVTIAVAAASTSERAIEDGIRSKTDLLSIAQKALSAIETHQPEAIVTLGGDCLVDLAPIAYLSERYGDELAILWVDAHPDIMGAAQMKNAHAHVLGMLMGEGDKDFSKLVRRPIHPQQVKDKIVSSGYDDMTFVSPIQRSIRTRTADRLAELLQDQQNTVDLNQEISKLGGLRPGMRVDNIDDGIISVNTGIDIIKSIPTVRGLIHSLLGLN